MTSGCYIDELESQRRELEARRAMLEERFKLRLATAQEFGVIHTHRLGRVREAFVAQCGAARTRNQSIIDRVRQSKDVFTEERALGGTSRNKLSHQMERFLSVADKLYPAWQEQQLQRKATQLGAIEEERFVTEQRRRVARQRFEQEQALAAVVSERRRRLAAARAHERNELALRQAQRDLSAAEDRAALKAALERANEAGRAARHDVLSEISNNPREQYGGDRGSSSSSSSNGGAPGGRERVYIHSDEDKDDDDDEEEEEEEEEEEDQFGPPGRGTKGRTNRAGDRRSTNASSPRSASRQVGEEDTRSHERSDLVRGGGGRSGGSVEEQLELRDVFCATRRGSPKAANGMRAAGAADSRHSSPSLASRANSNSARREPSTTEPNANEPGQDSKKRRDDERRRHRHRQRQRHQSDEDEQEPPPSLPPPPRLPNPRDGSSSGEYSADEGHRTAAVERTASLSEKKTRGEESEPLPPPPSPLPTIGSVSPPVRRRTPSFSSSSGSGGAVSPSGEAASSGALGAREGRGGALKAEGEPAEAPAVAWAGEGRPAAARRPSWSDEDDHGGATAAGPEEKPIRTNAPATLFSLAADLDQGGLVGGGDGSDEAEDAASSSGLPATTHPDERSGTLLSLSAAARAVAALTAKVERLAQASAPAPAAGRNSPASLLVLEAYRSAAAGRHDAAAWGADTTAAVAAASTVPADKAHSSSPPELESFGMVALCSAVLDLVAANATELLPPEALSGIVTAAQVRAQHRRGGKAGRVQLFDAVVGHARRLCTAAEATSEGEIGSGGAAGPAAIAAVFAACFEPVITAEADARGAERVRRKVLALLESAADPDGASTKRSQIPSAEVAALPAMVATAASGRGGGDLDGAESEKPLGKATIAASDHVGPKERRQQQQGRRGASTPSAAGASSGGVVLGGALGVGSGRKKKGSRLDLSSFGGSMAVFDTTVTAVGHGGSLNLPEFEDYESLEG